MIERKELSDEEKKILILSYYKNKTYVNLIYNQGEGDRYWNGFFQNIESINEGFVEFFDVIIKSPFPVQISKILTVQLSLKREIPVEQAIKIWENYKNENM